MEYEKCECNEYMGGLVKDHHYGLPITMVDFHTHTHYTHISHIP